MPTTPQTPKRERKSKPTAKQKALLKKALENLGSENPKTMGELLLEVGYSPTVAENPQAITESKGYRQLLNKYVTDDDLARVAQEGLNATKIISANITYGEADEKTNDFIEVPDHPTRHKFWKDLHVFKGHVSPETAAPTTYNQVNIFNQPEVQAKVNEFERQLKEQLSHD